MATTAEVQMRGVFASKHAWTEHEVHCGPSDANKAAQFLDPLQLILP